MRRAVSLWTATVGLLAALIAGALPVVAQEPPEKEAVARGSGGAVASVDADATAAGLEVLDAGGNAVDAAVAATAALGVTEPYSSGVGGGGFMVIYLADMDRVITIDGRETAPQAITSDLFIDPETGEPLPFFERVNSGLGVGVPGTALTWDTALRRYGTMSLAEVFQPAIEIAEDGFVVDETFSEQTADNAERFDDIATTADLFLVDGEAPEPGTVFTNPELADLYRMLAKEGIYDGFYRGPVAEAIVETVTDPPVVEGTERNWRPGEMALSDLADYEVRLRQPTVIEYDGLQIYGMPPPSSGGTTVGEALNIFEGTDQGVSSATLLGNFLQSTRLAFADRNAYLGDPEYVDVPVEGLLSEAFAAERREELSLRVDFGEPAEPGNPFAFQTDPSIPLVPDTEGDSTTHLTVSDDHGNVVAYTTTIEQTGGSGMAVDGYGFLLNNELTDFNPEAPHPNVPEPGKRPRSSISPTIVLEDGEPVLAVGTPGGSTIITTVAQVLLYHLALGLDLPDAIAAPRMSQRNTTTTLAEPAWFEPALRVFVTNRLQRRGYNLTETDELGAVTGIQFLEDGTVIAAAEPERRGGGAAAVQEPDDDPSASGQAAVIRKLRRSLRNR